MRCLGSSGNLGDKVPLQFCHLYLPSRSFDALTLYARLVTVGGVTNVENRALNSILQWCRMRGRLILLIGLLLGVAGPAQAAPPQQTDVQPLPLADYPRPPNDNGWGVHFSPAAARIEPHIVDFFVPELQKMGIKWTVVLNDGTTPKQDELIDRLIGAGIEPIVRIHLKYNDPLSPDALGHFVRYYTNRGVHYFQLYNEPNLEGEAGGWRPGEQISVQKMVDLWVPAARIVRQNGGYPGTPPLAPGGHYDDLTYYRQFLDQIKQRGDADVFEGAWIAIHNYGLNHPFDYPEEPVNLLSEPVSEKELAIYGLSTSDVDVEELNKWRRLDRSPNRPDGGQHKGDTIFQDSNAFRKFEAYHREFVQRFGFELPIIATEGGWLLGKNQDKRYPAVTVQAQTTWTLRGYEYMLDQAPDYFFAFAPWLVANFAANGVTDWFEPHAWYHRRCSTNTAQQISINGKALPFCQNGDVLPIVYRLKGHPRKNDVRRLPDPAQSAVVNVAPAVEPAPPPRYENGYMRIDLDSWDDIASEAGQRDVSPQAVLRERYPDQTFSNATLEVVTFKATTPSPAIKIFNSGDTLRLVNILDEPITVQLGGQVYTIGPRGAVIAKLPRIQYVRFATRRRITRDSPPAPTPTEPAALVARPAGTPTPEPMPTWPTPGPNPAWDGNWTPGGGRSEPAGEWSPQDTWALQNWPRPPHDTGLGLHFFPVGYALEDGSDVDRFIAELQRMHMTWATVLYADEHMLEIAAPRFREAGIMVVWRPYLKPYEDYLYAERDIRLLEQAGMPPYIQLYNEPDVKSEWEGEPIPDMEDRDATYIDNWIRAAADVWHRGGFPGIQVTSPDLLQKLLQELRRRDKLYLLNHTFFVPHSYGSNHPPSYPYDSVNQADHPGDTIDDDWISALGFLKYAHVFQNEVGFVPPFIVGEGGWTVSILEDGRYPRVTKRMHRDWHMELANWFQSGTLSNGEPLPDYLFGFTPWLYKAANRMQFADSAWFDSPLSGTKTETISAFEEMQPFERTFSWER